MTDLRAIQKHLGIPADGIAGPQTWAAIAKALGVAAEPANVFDHCLAVILRHEGGFVNHPKDPGGATNKGVTIGTLKRLGIDVDGDGDSDIVDLRNLRQSDLERVYKLFYWDAVRADHLPSGVDYAVFDFAVNSGPARAAKHLQKVIGVEQDGDIGPQTLAAVANADPQDVVNAICDSRLRFMRSLKKLWPTFGKGWSSRVSGVLRLAKDMAITMPVQAPAKPAEPAPKPAAPIPAVKPTATGKSPLAAILAGLAALAFTLYQFAKANGVPLP